MTARDRGLVARGGLCLVLMVVYEIAFYCPAGGLQDRPDLTIGGGAAFCIAAAALLEPSRWLENWFMVVGWVPNPLYWIGIALLLSGRWRAAGVAGLAAFVMAAIWWWPFGWEGGGRLLYGYYIWWGSMGLLVLVGFLGPLTKKLRANAPKHTPASL